VCIDYMKTPATSWRAWLVSNISESTIARKLKLNMLFDKAVMRRNQYFGRYSFPVPQRVGRSIRYGPKYT